MGFVYLVPKGADGNWGGGYKADNDGERCQQRYLHDAHPRTCWGCLCDIWFGWKILRGTIDIRSYLRCRDSERSLDRGVVAVSSFCIRCCGTCLAAEVKGRELVFDITVL